MMTEFLVLQSHNITNLAPHPTISIGSDQISPSTHAKDLGVIIDSALSLSPHVSSVCNAANFQLHRISCIRQFLTSDATKTLVHSLFSSRLDYCNSVLASLPNHELLKLQSVQNAMAHLVSRCNKYDRIIPILIDLHWLPI